MTDQSPTPASEFVLQSLARVKAALDDADRYGSLSASIPIADLKVVLAARPTPADDAERREGIAIPEGMVAWHGGDSAPEDWDGGNVMRRNGRVGKAFKHPNDAKLWGLWSHGKTANRDASFDIIAYTPKATPTPEAVINAISAERRRQIGSEGWTPEHDDAHADGSMALAAACYAMFASVGDVQRATTDISGALTVGGKTLHGWSAFLEIWPWDRKWWKPKSRRADLIRAGALIVAEIERLDRKEQAI